MRFEGKLGFTLIEIFQRANFVSLIELACTGIEISVSVGVNSMSWYFVTVLFDDFYVFIRSLV